MHSANHVRPENQLLLWTAPRRVVSLSSVVMGTEVTVSHDITVRADGLFSRSASKQAVLDFLRIQPNLVPNGASGFALDDRPKRWMEIDLDVVTEDGDSVEEPLDTHSEINCIRLHIPYVFLKSSTLNEGYLPLAFRIADFLKWEVYDEQLGESYP